MLSISYVSSKWAVIEDLGDFYRSGMKETRKVKSLVDGIKVMFGLPANKVKLEVVEGSNIYRVSAFTKES